MPERRFLRGDRDRRTITPHSASILDGIQTKANVLILPISSMARTPSEQASAMLANMLSTRTKRSDGTWDYSKQLRLYREPGQSVIKAGALALKRKHTEVSAAEVMRKVILRLGPEKVSSHCLPEGSPKQIFDIPPSKLPDDQEARLVEELRKALKDGRISKLLLPERWGGNDPAIHVEVTQPLVVNTLEVNVA